MKHNVFKNTSQNATPTLITSTCSSVDLTGSGVRALSLAGCTSANARPIGWRLESELTMLRALCWISMGGWVWYIPKHHKQEWSHCALPMAEEPLEHVSEHNVWKASKECFHLLVIVIKSVRNIWCNYKQAKLHTSRTYLLFQSYSVSVWLIVCASIIREQRNFAIITVEANP